MRHLLSACRYLTILPVPRGEGSEDLGRAAGWFPIVGAVLGSLLALTAVGLGAVVPPLVLAALVVALWALLTGGLHLDGLADTADGLGGGWSREEALAIMRDARTGAYGVAAIVLVLGLKMAVLASLTPSVRWRVLVTAPVLGRLAPVLLARLCPAARPEGAGHAFTRALEPAGAGVASVVAVAVALGLLGWAGAVLGLMAAAAAAGFALYLRRRLGGLTGDCLGALVEGTEAATLAVASGLAHLGLA